VLSYEKLLDETGREMHGSLGNAIDADEGFERMGADVMRWMYCAQPPTQNIRFGFGPAEEVKRKLLTLWNSASFLVTYAAIEGFRPRYDDLAPGALAGAELRPLDRWLLARTQAFLAEAEESYEAFMTVGGVRALESYVDDLSNWYIRRSRRRFYGDDGAAFRTLWYGLVQALRTFSPIMPFLTEHLWRTLVCAACDDAPASVFLAGWPQADATLADEALLAQVAQVRQVVELGRRARSDAGVKNRQPLRQAHVRGAPLARSHVEEIQEELRVKSVGFDTGPVARVSLKPNLPVLGPKLGARLRDVRDALLAGEVEHLEDGRLRAAGVELEPGEVIRGEQISLPGWAIQEEGALSVALDIEIDPELALEGRALDLIHTIQRLRKESGLEITDRIEIRWDGDGGLEDVFAAHGDRIAEETLAVRIERVPGQPLSVVKAS
jgi:isoleucyl-tRNA synthetase